MHDGPVEVQTHRLENCWSCA